MCVVVSFEDSLRVRIEISTKTKIDNGISVKTLTLWQPTEDGVWQTAKRNVRRLRTCLRPRRSSQEC